jgi:hypothetical protein
VLDAGRQQDALAQGRVVGLAGHALDDGGEQGIADIGIVVARARLCRQRGRPGARQIGGAAEHFVILAQRMGQAGGMGEQLVQRDRGLIVRRVHENLAERGVCRQSAALN